MFVLPNKPQTKQNIILQSISLYLKTFFIATPYTFLANFILCLPLLILLFLPSSNYCFLCFFIGSFIINLFILGACIFHLYCYCHHIPSSFLNSLKHLFFKIIPLLFSIIIYGLIVLGGTMLLLIPGIILSVSLMFTFVLQIIGNQTLLQNFISSHRLVWGNWWHVALVISFPLLFNIMCSLALFFLWTLASNSYHLSYPLLSLLSFSSNIILQTLLLPFTLDVMLLLLHDLKLRQTLPKGASGEKALP